MVEEQTFLLMEIPTQEITSTVNQMAKVCISGSVVAFTQANSGKERKMAGVSGGKTLQIHRATDMRGITKRI